jgi:hypothetical protein
MKSLKSILACAILLSIGTSYAQEEVIIIDRKDYKRKREKNIRLNENTQVFKFAPLNLLAGEINFGYERQMSKKGSVDIELGPTISKIGFGLNSHLANDFEPNINEMSSMGFVTQIGYRYYPLDETEALNRFYVSPVYRFKLMNHKVQDASNFVPGVQKGNYVRNNFFFNFGYQSWLSSSFSIDFYAGFGIGMHSSRDWYSTSVFQNNDWVYEWREDYRSGATYVFNAGIKVGIGAQ